MFRDYGVVKDATGMSQLPKKLKQDSGERWLLRSVKISKGRANFGGDSGIRTRDLLLAKQALYQLSYVPREGYSPKPYPKMVGLNGLEPLTSRLSGVCSNQLSYKPLLVGSGSSPTLRETLTAADPKIVSELRCSVPVVI